MKQKLYFIGQYSQFLVLLLKYEVSEICIYRCFRVQVEHLLNLPYLKNNFSDYLACSGSKIDALWRQRGTTQGRIDMELSFI